MKKLLLAALLVFGMNTINAQEKVKEDIKKGADVVEKEAVKLYNQAKTGGFKVGANIGVPFSTTREVTSFNIGADVVYLFEVANNLEVGLLTGYTHFFADGDYQKIEVGPYLKNNAFKTDDTVVVKHKDAGFIPIAASGRYYFSNRKFFAGLDIGFALNVSGDDVDNGFYFRPKFGFNLGKITLLGMFQQISGGADYSDGLNTLKVSGFNSFNVGIEYGF